MGLRINNISKVLGSFTGTSPDPLLTSSATTGQVDTANNLFGSLASANIWVGSAANLPVARLISGDISIDNLGVAAITPGTIVNADINATAAIAFSKLAVLPVSKAVVTDGSGFITTSVTSAIQIGYLSTTTSDIQVQLNAKQATITGAASSIVTTNLNPNIVAVSDGAGKIASSTVSTTALGYITNLTSDAQTQLNSKLTVSLGATVTGDIIYYNGSAWTNLPRGTLGQTLQSTSGSIAWGTPTINGIPSGGTTHQFLAKNSSTNFDASWYTLTTSLITDIVATAAQINSLTTYLTTGGVPTGTNGQVLSISAGTMVWATISGLGTVTSVDVSGGTTGLTTSGGPITTSGTITLSGTLGTINGGTGQTAVAVGDILYGSAINTWSRLAAGTNGYVLTMSGGVPIWATGGGGGGMAIGGTVTSGTPGSVLWVGVASALSQDNNNFYWNSGSHVLSVNTNGDFTGIDSINVYNQIDAYKPNSTQGAVGSGTEAGYSVSSSRGTGAAPTVISSGDLLGGFAGWGYTGSVPAYTSLGGMWITAEGAASTLGGKLDFYTRADGGVLVKRLTINNTGSLTLSSFATAGVVHNAATGLFSTSLIVAADVTTNTLTYDKLQQGSPLSVLGNSTNSTANLADIAGTNNQVLRVNGTTLGFGSIDLSQSTTVGSSRLAYANLAQGAGLSVLGVTGNVTADNASIVATSDFQILRRSGTSVGFGSIDLSQSNAVGSSVLGVANGGTGSSTGGFWALATGGTLSGVNTISSAFPSGLIFTSTWTATGNNQYGWNFTGTLTSENVASDFWNGLVIDPTFTRNGANPATQTATALLINPTFVNNPTNQYILRAQSAGVDRFRIASNGDVTIVPFSTAGIVHNNASGILSSSLIVSSDVATNTFWNIGGNTLTGNAIFGDTSVGGFTISFYTKNTAQLTIDNTGLATFNGRVVHTATTTLPGLNVGTFAGDPSGSVNGDVWYNSTSNDFRVKSNATVLYGMWSTVVQPTIGALTFITNLHNLISTSANLTYDGKKLSVGGTAASSGVSSVLTITGRADTNITASTEQVDVDFVLNRSVQWAAGLVGTQRQVYLRGVTLTGASATASFTNAYTLYVDPPLTGTNASITSSFAAAFNGSVVILPQGVVNSLTINNNGANQIRLFSGGSLNYQSNAASGQHNFINGVGASLTGAFVTFSMGNGPPSNQNIVTMNGATGVTSTLFGFTNAGNLTLTQAILTSLWAPAITVNAAPHTAYTAATEFIDLDFKLNRNVTWIDGTVATQRFVYFRGATLNKTTTSATFTNAYNVFIDSLTAGTGVTITNSYALGLNGNLSLITAGNGIYIKQGTNATCGRGTLVGGTVTINTTKVTSTCEIFITDRGVVTTNLGSIYEDSGSRVNGTSFTVKSTNVLDTSSFCWLIIEAP